MRNDNFFYNVIMFLLLVFTVVGMTMFFCTSAFADSRGYINTDNVNFRSSPNGELINTYNAGQAVTVTSIDGDWSLCIIDNQSGYVYSSYITLFPDATPSPSPEATPEPTAEPTPVPTAEPTPEPTPIIVYVTPEPTPIPEPTPEPTTDPQILSYQAEQLTVLGSIEAILVFFTVVILCYFSYKFLRIFF